MKETFIEQLILARTLDKDSDYDIYLKVDNEIFKEKKIYSLETYFYGFHDSTLGDSLIDGFQESIFFYLKELPLKIYSEEFIIESLVRNISIFIPHASEWYSSIVNYIIYHYQGDVSEIFINNLKNISNEKREEIGSVLTNAKRDWFIYDDNGRVEKKYRAIIDYCFLG